MPNLNNDVAAVKGWATGHIFLALAIGVAVGLVIGLLL